MEKKTSEAQLRAVKKYKEKVNRVYLDFYPTEEDIWLHVTNQKNKQGYVKDLIRKDMEKGK